MSRGGGRHLDRRHPLRNMAAGESAANERKEEMEVADILKELEKRREAVGRERDALDDLSSEVDGLRETCQAAFDDISLAIEHLSELARTSFLPS